MSSDKDLQPAKALGAAAAKAARLLMEGERILAWAEQTDLARWWIWPPDGVVVTDRRVLFLTNGLFSFRFRDFHWEHVEDVHLSLGMSSATIQISATDTKSGLATKVAAQRVRRRSVRGLKKDQAEGVYREGQRMEQIWRERNRRRVMEETQVSRGQVVVHQGAMGAIGTVGGAGGPATDPVARLNRVKELLDSGVLTPEEYESKKAEIMKDL